MKNLRTLFILLVTLILILTSACAPKSVDVNTLSRQLYVDSKDNFSVTYYLLTKKGPVRGDILPYGIDHFSVVLKISNPDAALKKSNSTKFDSFIFEVDDKAFFSTNKIRDYHEIDFSLNSYKPDQKIKILITVKRNDELIFFIPVSTRNPYSGEKEERE